MASALLIMMLAGLFVAAYAAVLTTRANQTTFADVAVKRRLSLENSRQLSSQFMYENAFNRDHTSLNHSNLLGLFPGGWGGADASGWDDPIVFDAAHLPGTLTTIFPYNYAGVRPFGSFVAARKTQLPTSLATTLDGFSAWSFAKTSSPLLSGDAVIVFRKPDTAPGQIEIGSPGLPIRVDGRMVVRDPDSFFAPSTPNPLEIQVRATASKGLYVQTEHAVRRIYCRDENGSVLAPSNLPASLSTTGPIPDGTGPAFLYKNALNVINNPSNPSNSLWHFMEREQAAGTGDYETINTNTPAGSPSSPWRTEDQVTPTYMPPAWPSGYPAVFKVMTIRLGDPNLKHLRVEGLFSQVVLEGQNTAAAYTAASLLPPVILLFTDTAGNMNFLKHLVFLHENGRRIVIGHKNWNGEAITFEWRGVLNATGNAFAYDWRAVIVNEHRTIWAQLPANILQSINITGGLMTNWTFKRTLSSVGPATRITFRPENNPEPAGASGTLFSRLVPRDGWIENYFLPTQP